MIAGFPDRLEKEILRISYLLRERVFIWLFLHCNLTSFIHSRSITNDWIKDCGLWSNPDARKNALWKILRSRYEWVIAVGAFWVWLIWRRQAKVQDMFRWNLYSLPRLMWRVIYLVLSGIRNRRLLHEVSNLSFSKWKRHIGEKCRNNDPFSVPYEQRVMCFLHRWITLSPVFTTTHTRCYQQLVGSPGRRIPSVRHAPRAGRSNISYSLH